MLKDQALLDIQLVNVLIVFWPNASESLLPHKDPLSQIQNCPGDRSPRLRQELDFESFPFKEG